MSREVLLEQCKDKVLEGKDYLAIRRWLENQMLSEEDFKWAMSKTDDFLVELEMEQNSRQGALIQIGIGLVIFLFGAATTWISLTGDGSKKYIWYGAVLVGAWLATRGWKAYQEPITLTGLDFVKKKKNMFERF